MQAKCLNIHMLYFFRYRSDREKALTV